MKQLFFFILIICVVCCNSSCRKVSFAEYRLEKVDSIHISYYGNNRSNLYVCIENQEDFSDVVAGIEEGLKEKIGAGKFEIKYLNAGGNDADLQLDAQTLVDDCPKADLLLKALHGNGLKTGLLTRGCREYAEAALDVCGISGLLDGVVARDDYPESEAKPSPKAMEHMAEQLGVRPDEILFFGDHTFDYQCARDSGSGFVAVLTGTFTYDDWKGIDGIEIYDSIGDYYDKVF